MIVVVLLCWFLYAVRSILPPFILALLIAVLLEPLVQRMMRRGVRRVAAVIAVMSVFFLGVGGLIVLAVPSVTQQVTTLSARVDSLTNSLLNEPASRSPFVRWNPVQQATPRTASSVDKLLKSQEGLLERVGLPTTQSGLVKEYVDPHRERITGFVRGFFSSFIGILASAASQIFLLLFTPIFVLLLLLDMDGLRVRSISWIPPSIRRGTLGLLREVGQVIVAYIRGLMVTVAIWTTLCAIVLTVLGVPYSILLALLFGAVYIIPYAGAIIMNVSVLLVTGFAGANGNFFMSFSDPWTFAMVVTGIFFAVFMIYDNIINPKIVGGSVGLNPLLSMFVVFSGAALMGLIGMLIAYPLAGTIKVILNRVLRVTGATTDEVALPAVPLRHQST
ncbi:MAG: AI-2E family transporter [Chthonomonas sp.]|nr:AI-2E family transporter [Chthonomonas sp.]